MVSCPQRGGRKLSLAKNAVASVAQVQLSAMNEIGLDISGQRSKGIMEYLGHIHMGTVITVCSNAEDRCPIFPFSTLRLY